MKFNVNQQDFQSSKLLSRYYRERNTLPILSNILLDAQNSRLTITAMTLILFLYTK